MNHPTTHTAKNWMLEPKKGETGLETYYIGQIDAEAIAKHWRNAPNAELKKNGNMIALVSRNDYRLRPGGGKDEDNTKSRWICDYGTRHTMNEGCYTDDNGERAWSASKCGCLERFNAPKMIFVSWCQANYDIKYSHDITPEIQRKFLETQTI